MIIDRIMNIPATRANVRELRHRGGAYGAATIMHSGNKWAGLWRDGTMRAIHFGGRDARLDFLSLSAEGYGPRRQAVWNHRVQRYAWDSARRLP